MDELRWALQEQGSSDLEEPNGELLGAPKYKKMLLKLATLNRRIGGLEQKMRDFEISRRKKLKLAEKAHGEITVENANRSQALVNYVKYFYENMDECEEILTENLKMICFSFNLEQEDIKDHIDKIP